MKKNLILIILFIFVPLFCNSQADECGWTGEADRSYGNSACFSLCFQGYESCEAVYNERYKRKLEALLYESLEDVCRQWAGAIFRVPVPHNQDLGVCDIFQITQDIDSEHWNNVAIAINYLNRCVNTCDGH